MPCQQKIGGTTKEDTEITRINGFYGAERPKTRIVLDAGSAKKKTPLFCAPGATKSQSWLREMFSTCLTVSFAS
jgi:hypothetical protein